MLCHSHSLIMLIDRRFGLADNKIYMTRTRSTIREIKNCIYIMFLVGCMQDLFIRLYNKQKYNLFNM